MSDIKVDSRQPHFEPNTSVLPVVIVGNGPVGMQAARLLLENNFSTPVVIYGSEQHIPYNRVKLSSVLAGVMEWDGLTSDVKDDSPLLIKRYGVTIEEINAVKKTVIDDLGNIQPYEKLILATGSNPYIPEIPGISLSGRYTLRSIKDLNQLLARQIRSRHTVILGGGLLGLEAAKAMQRWNTEVTVIEHAPYLLSKQLDESAGHLLAKHIEDTGIKLVFNSGIHSINGGSRITSITLNSRQTLDCDTVIIATGIVPDKSLALLAGIKTGRGIQVDDSMRTSISDIYAVGECCEHRGNIYGLVAPGLEQAGVAVNNILGKPAKYQGAISASRLKVLDQPVLSIGNVGQNERKGLGTHHKFVDEENGIYRKLIIHRYRLIGAILVGESEETMRIQNHVIEQRWVFPWQLLRFNLTGLLWPQQELPGVSEWPSNATVCQCTGVTRGTIGACIDNGAKSCDEIRQQTGASSVCGSCRTMINDLLGNNKPAEPEEYSTLLTSIAIFGFLISSLFFLPIILPYANSSNADISIDLLWRDGLIKQITGYSIIAMVVIGLTISLRKRWKKLRETGSYSYWRLFHIVVGALIVVSLLLHTGFRTGSGLNFWLMFFFLGLIIAGSFYTAILSQQHRLASAQSITAKKRTLNWHIFLFWPVPVLLGFHILKVYWF